MSTDIRPEVSIHCRYWIPRERYYELKHFCQQYSTWKKSREDILKNVFKSSQISGSRPVIFSDRTSSVAIKLAAYSKNIDLIETTAKDVGKDLYGYLIEGITKPRSYTYLSTKMQMPCSRTLYFDLYREFFYVLDKRRE